MKQAKNPRVDMNDLQAHPYIATFGSIATYIAIAKFIRIGIDFQISESHLLYPLLVSLLL